MKESRNFEHGKMRNIYYYLEKINFEKRVTDEAKFIRDRKNSPDFDCLMSSFVFVQFVFGMDLITLN